MSQSGQLANATGSMGIVSALGITIQWMFSLGDVTVSNEQAAALSILMFPVVHLVFIKIGAMIDRQQVPLTRRGSDQNGEAKQ